MTVRLPGWCLACRRFRPVVSARDIDAMLAAMRHGLTVGTCDECADEADLEARR